MMGDESGESMEPMVDGEKLGVDSRDEGKHSGIGREDDVDGRASVTKDEERVL